MAAAGPESHRESHPELHRESASQERESASGAVASRRLFFALLPDGELRARLAAELRPVLAGLPGRAVSAERLHITLLFLGTLESRQQACVEAAAARVHAAPFTLVLDRIDYWRHAGVLWLGPRPSAALDALHLAIAAAIAGCAIPLETRPYRPHLTLMRGLRRPPAPLPLAPAAVRWEARDWALMESTPAGYRMLGSWPLA
jgi:2'-5' RNA ligase